TRRRTAVSDCHGCNGRPFGRHVHLAHLTRLIQPALTLEIFPGVLLPILATGFALLHVGRGWEGKDRAAIGCRRSKDAPHRRDGSPQRLPRRRRSISFARRRFLIAGEEPRNPSARAPGSKTKRQENAG